MTDQLPQKSLTTPIPANETERLAALHRYKILDTPPEAAFDRITALAARLFQMPTALISLVDESRAWFKSRYGFDWQEMPHDATLCSFALLDDDVFIVPDAQQDDRFACNPFVQDEPGVRFYAGAPLLSHDGFNLGTLCVVDTQPRDPLSAEQQATLVDLAAMVVDELELRLATHKTAQSEEKYRTLFESIDEGFCICEMLFNENGIPIDYRFLEVNSVFEQLTGLEQATGKTIRELVPNFEAAWIEIYGTVVQTGEPVRVENKSTAMNRWFDVNAFRIGEAQSHQFAILFTNITKRKRTEQALRESEERSVLAIRVAQLGTWRYVLATNLVELDARMREIWGEPEDAVVLPLSQIVERIHPDDRAQVTSAISAALDPTSSDTYEIDYRIVWDDGSERWISANGQATFAGKGTLRQAVEFLGTAVDITDRKQAEVALQQTSAELERQVQRFDAITTSVPDFIYTFDQSGRFTYSNQQLLNLLQKTLAEVLGKNFFDLEYPIDLATRLQNQIQQVIETRQPVRDETPYTSVVGTRAYEYIFVPLFDANGAVESVAGVTRDITERKQSEATLLEQANLLQLIIDSIGDGLILANPQGEFVLTNQAAESIFGRLTNEKPCDEWSKTYGLFLPDGQTFFPDEQLPLFRAIQGEYVNDVEVFVRHNPAVEGRWVSISGFPVRDRSGELTGGVITCRDITERQRILQQEQAARASAEQANRIKDEFLAVLSHELRTPLNPILGWTRLLQLGKLDAARTTEALKIIERNAKLQAQLIEDLLDISRIMQGKLSWTATPVSLTEVISEALETVRLAAEAKHITIRLDLDLDPAICSVSGDAARLQQVVWNLLTNAVKFTSHGGQVTVEVRQLGRFAQIRVIDTGKGINPNFLPHVFEYFRQEDGSITRRFGGLGLGLAIVRQIVEMHGGTVRAESQGENQGATFIVLLPVLPQATPILSEPSFPKTTTKVTLDNIKILLVDDDPDTREFQTFLLEQSGARVTAVTSGLEALQALEQLIPNAIVSDIGMAQMDGYTLISQIRSRPANRGGTIPAIALTAYAAEVDHLRAIGAGFQAHITKPVKPEILIKTIVSLLNRNQQ